MPLNYSLSNGSFVLCVFPMNIFFLVAQLGVWTGGHRPRSSSITDSQNVVHRPLVAAAPGHSREMHIPRPHPGTPEAAVLGADPAIWVLRWCRSRTSSLCPEFKTSLILSNTELSSIQTLYGKMKYLPDALKFTECTEMHWNPRACASEFTCVKSSCMFSVSPPGRGQSVLSFKVCGCSPNKPEWGRAAQEGPGLASAALARLCPSVFLEAQGGLGRGLPRPAETKHFSKIKQRTFLGRAGTNSHKYPRAPRSSQILFFDSVPEKQTSWIYWQKALRYKTQILSFLN